ncbi:hypothetical protein [Aminipila sp.]|uniref:hypothetical protein n=1 Tax=Aminipila sp. TaxID=2060095 RepID=UPI0028977165|nr:hypothetical protein [Aminipila sp.]
MLKRTNRIIDVVHTGELSDFVDGFYSVEVGVYFRNVAAHSSNLIIILYKKG